MWVMRQKFILITLIAITLLAIGFFAGYTIPHPSSEHSQPHQSLVSTPDQSTDPRPIQTASLEQNKDSLTDQISNQRRNAITRAVSMASQAVVGINVIEVREYRYRDPFSQFFNDDPFFRQFFGDRTFRQEVKGLGSGFLISPDGYILTNDHVAGNAKQITVTLTSGERYSAELVGTDLVSDIALLKIDGKNLPYLKLGNSDDVLIGEWVIALGNPFGLFDIADKPTVTVGVVSAVGLNLRGEGGRYYRGMIQTDAAINSGNSGGPLLNSLGEVIGINAVIFTPNQGSVGVGFAIPINRVKSIVAELKHSGRIERNFWTGLEIQNIDRRVARYFGLEKAEGVIVTDVRQGSPASQSGFRPGDIIYEINGERIINDDSVNSLISVAKAGDVWKVKVYREKQILTLDLKLERRSA
jgi:serine protease Do